MKHKVRCMDCGKEDKIEVIKGKQIPKNWYFYGRLNYNSLCTEKFVYKVINFNPFRTEKIKNMSYNPEVKTKTMELWVCEKCQKEAK